ncbi:3D domain-containing protein [Heyndrickxia acidicola]|uniref:3D domain-containing protein n=1 Tax=Heyndrickxia acidicola TaxID=209389 RepID=A0ABU6MIM1_9BACI|nr:3D domain-containing protein [Heyndrickxia acidicola]MED1204520.1 3D domain-containing protein [Heyndrickxia acidicola]
MQYIRRSFVTFLTIVLCISATIGVYAKTNQSTLHNAQNKLEQNQTLIQNKEAQKQQVSQEMNQAQQEWNSIQAVIDKNKQDVAVTEQKIKQTNQLIEQKKEEIVKLEDKVLARKNIIKERLVALQQSDRINIVIDTLLNADSFGDFVNRISAVSTLFNADDDIIKEQKDDIAKIQEDKKAIDKKQASLQEDQSQLLAKQNELQANLKAKQMKLNELKSSYSSINKDLSAANQSKSSLQAKISDIQSALQKEEQAAQAQAKQIAVQPANQTPPQSVSNDSSPSGSKEFYVTATAYSHDDTKGDITTLGYNIATNPNMKLIAVDPSVIPLGKKVWVEGYGIAIAGDTGGAIQGNRIDILMPNSQAALNFGRQTVKVIILN